MNQNSSLREDEIEELRTMLCDDFGYAPFDVEKAKRILGEGKDYVLKRGKSKG